MADASEITDAVGNCEDQEDFDLWLNNFRVALEQNNIHQYDLAIEKMVLIDPAKAHYYAGRGFELKGMLETALDHYIRGSQSDQEDFYKKECWSHASRLNKNS